MMLKNNKYLVGTLALSLFLFLPFVFRSSFVKIELFPAVIMPSGSKKVNLAAKYLEFKDLNLYGIDSTGKERKLNHTQFLHPIPVWYLSSLVHNGFGIHPDVKNEPRMFRSFAKITQKDKEEGRKFLIGQLRKQKCIDSVLIVKNEVAFFNMSTKVIDSVVVEDITRYDLYRE